MIAKKENKAYEAYKTYGTHKMLGLSLIFACSV